MKYLLTAVLLMTGCTSMKTFLATPCVDVLRNEMEVRQAAGYVPYNRTVLDGIQIFVWANQETLTVSGVAFVTPKSPDYVVKNFELPNEAEQDSCKQDDELVRVITFSKTVEAQ